MFRSKKSFLSIAVALSVVVLATSASVLANPVSVAYVDTPAQCANPPNQTLAEEVGSAVFDADETISYVVVAAVAGDCGIALGGGNDHRVTATNTTGHDLVQVFVVADSGTTFDNWDGMAAGQRAKKLADVWLNGGVITFELMNVAPNVAPNFNSLGVPSAAAPSNFSIVANPRAAAGRGACALPAPLAPDCVCSATWQECDGYGGKYLGDGTTCADPGICIPTLTEWGVAVMTLLVLVAATVVIMRRRALTAGG